MYQVKRRGQVGFEDLMRELSMIEQQMLPENSALAMNLMVLEAKIRARFEQLEQISFANTEIKEPLDTTELTLKDIQALIPQDIGAYLSFEDVERKRRRMKAVQTMAMAAVLAVLTAVGVFGLASVLQLTLSWLA